MNGYHAATGKPVKGFGDLKADGSTACGAWIYSGVYAPTAEEPDGHNHAANRNGDDWVALGWGFAWPANRRIMYNRAAADPRGNPWPKEARLARQFGNGAKGYVYWDPDAEGPDPANPSRLVRGRWVGLDVPDFPRHQAPDSGGQARRPGPRFPRRRLAVHHEGRRQGLALRSLGPGGRPAARALRAVRITGAEPGLPGAVQQPGGQGLSTSPAIPTRRSARPSIPASSRPTA